jgi:hypothetical protein
MATLREIILSNKTCPVSLIQKFAGLCISMTLAIPGAKLYSSACNRAISKALRSNTVVDVDTELREEVAHWQFLDKWSQPFPWLNERHDVLSISSDSSDYKWGAIYTSGHKKYEIADYWSDDVKESPIMIKEVLALKNALFSYGSQIKNKRIEAKVDNQAVVFAWKNQYSKNGILNYILKDIFQITIQSNCYLNLSYIRTTENLSDVLSKSDATLSKRAWIHIQQSFGPHDVDMFSLDSNAMLNNIGDPLAHFTPFPTPETSGVDAFAQSYSCNKLYYAFPPFCLLATVVNFILQEKINCTLVFPEFKPIQPWFTVIMSKVTEIIPIGFKGDTGVFLFPSKKVFFT